MRSGRGGWGGRLPTRPRSPAGAARRGSANRQDGKRVDARVPFDGLRRLLGRLGFDERIRGGHHIFTRAGVEEILNLQPKGRDAKAYQVKQVRAVIVECRLAGGADDQ